MSLVIEKKSKTKKIANEYEIFFTDFLLRFQQKMAQANSRNPTTAETAMAILISSVSIVHSWVVFLARITSVIGQYLRAGNRIMLHNL